MVFVEIKGDLKCPAYSFQGNGLKVYKGNLVNAKVFVELLSFIEDSIESGQFILVGIFSEDQRY